MYHWDLIERMNYNDPTCFRRVIARCIGPCVFCAPLDRYIGRHIDRHIGRVSVDISTDARPICRSICRPTLGRYIGRDVSVDILTDISTEISADNRPICRPRVVVRQSADMSIDRLPTFRRYLTATCVHSTGDCSLSRRHNLTLVSDFCWGAQISYFLYLAVSCLITTEFAHMIRT